MVFDLRFPAFLDSQMLDVFFAFLILQKCCRITRYRMFGGGFLCHVENMLMQLFWLQCGTVSFWVVLVCLQWLSYFIFIRNFFFVPFCFTVTYVTFSLYLRRHVFIIFVKVISSRKNCFKSIFFVSVMASSIFF